MAFTAVLPLATNYSLQAVPQQTATRVIPASGNQPNFGLMATMVIPGSNPMANAFYDTGLNYVNTLGFPLPPTNMPVNMYLGFIPGIMKAPIAAGQS